MRTQEERKKSIEMKEGESMVSRRLQKLRAEETQMHRDEILNDSAYTVDRYGKVFMPTTKHKYG